MKGASILYSILSPDPDWEDDFNHWYEHHQIPVRVNCDGFLGAQRYHDPDRGLYLGLFEIDTLQSLETEAYRKMRAQPNAQTAWMLSNTLEYERYTANEIISRLSEGVSEQEALDSDFLRAIFFSVPENREQEFTQWYDEEHIPSILKIPGWQMVRRFTIEEFDPSPWSHLTLQYINKIDALDLAERDEVQVSKTYKSLSEEPWFRPSIHNFKKYKSRILSPNF
ncbi:MAG: hypothetical protein VW226_04220 [Rhodospirillaceae bacterium]